MILNCPQCTSRFLVADSLIPPEGRSVRCGACSHQWFVESAQSVPPAPTVELSPELLAATQPAAAPAADANAAPVAGNVPALATPRMNTRPLMLAAPVLALVWFMCAFITHAPRWVETPGLSALYHLFGVHTTRGLAFAELAMQRQEEEGRTRFILSGKIINRAEEPRTVPTVRVVLKDKEGGEVWARKYPVNLLLKAGEEYPFRIVNVETSFGARVETIVVDLGSGMELMTR